MRGDRLKILRLNKKISQQELAGVLGVDRTMIGKYELKNNTPSDEILTKMANFFNVEKAYLLGVEEKTKKKTGIKIPVLGRVVAGIPIEAITEIIDYEEITENVAATGEFFALIAKGDSMNPTIIDGDILIIRQQDTVADGQVAIILIDGMDATVKRVHVTEGGISLLGDNPAIFTPRFYTNAEIETLPIKIIGKVVEIRRRLL